ncbi:Tad domain-containing protein [Rhodoglobus sp. NPDC076762]
MNTSPRMRDDDGSALVLTIFYGFLSLVLIFLVVAATSLYLERKRLFSLADGAALVGAESYDLDDVVRTPQGFRPQLEPAKVASAVGEYLAAAPTAEFEGLSVEQATSLDASSATVSLSAYWRPPFVSLLVPEGVRIDVTASARSIFS